MINVLYIGIGPNTGGPIESLIQIISNLDTRKFKPYIFSLPNPHIHSLTELKEIREAVIIESDLWINNWLQSSKNDYRTTTWHKLKLPGRIVRSIYNGFRIAKLIKSYKIDIVHTNIELIIDGAIGALIALKPHVWHIRAPIGQQGAVKHFLGQRICCSLISALSTKIITNSHVTRNSINNYIKSEKIKLIYNGISPDKFITIKPNNSLRNLLGIKSDEKIVASIGYMSKIKGGDVFLSIAKKVIEKKDDIVFVWIGPSIERKNDPFYESFIDSLDEKDIEDRILLTGERFDIPDLLGDVDVFLQPMINGSWSRVVLEAMAASRPVVAIEEKGVSEVINNKINGIIVKNEREAITEILNLLDDENLRKMIGENACEHVTKEFNNLRTTSALMAVYESLVSK